LAAAGFVHTVETVEDVRQMFGGNAFAVVSVIIQSL
jgi:hypothetical protein